MKYTLAGIDIGTHTTRVIVVELPQQATDRGLAPRVLGVGTAETTGMHRGYIMNHHEVVKTLKQAIRNAEKSSNIPIDRAVIALGGISLTADTITQMITINRADGVITELDIERAIEKCEEQLHQQKKNRHILHALPSEYILDDQKMTSAPIGLRGNRLSIKTLLISCLENHYTDLVRAVHDAGIDVLEVRAAPLAASYIALSPKQKIAGCVLVDIGSETVSASVFEDNHMTSLEVFALGSSHITNDIALGFQLDIQDAESLKQGKTSGDHHQQPISKKKIDEIIEARLADIFELVQNHLKKIKRDGVLPGGIIITGGGSQLASITDFARATLRIPSQTLSLNKSKMNDSTWFVAYGLTMFISHDLFVEKNIFEKMSIAIQGFFKKIFDNLIP